MMDSDIKIELSFKEIFEEHVSRPQFAAYTLQKRVDSH